MRIQKYNKQPQKFQMGGEMPQGGEQAPVEQGAAQVGQDEQAAMQQLAEIANSIISQMGPENAAMLAQVIMEMLQSEQPVGEEPQGEPVFKKGGKICKRIKKCCKKSKA